MERKDDIDKVSEYIAEDPDLVRNCIVQNYTTKQFSRDYDICDPDPDWESGRRQGSTNPELPNFFQTIYHAGTPSQFYRYTVPPIFTPIENFEGSKLIGPMAEKGYVINDQTLSKTFHYLFDTFKKGIYVQIKENTIKVYLPFSNTNYRNDWGGNLKTDPKLKTTPVKLQERNFRDFTKEYEFKTMVNRDTNRWYANYCIFRNTIYKNSPLRFKDDEGDKSIVNFLELLTRVCEERKVPDVCFFISPRDYPVLRKDLDHPYKLLYPEGEVPNLAGKFPLNKGMIPIFTQSITNEYNELLIPTDDDIVGLLCGSSTTFYQRDWSAKKTKAVFRGSATGCGVTAKSNPRLKLIDLSREYPDLIDAELTGLNAKLKVDPVSGYIDIIDKRKYKKGSYMDTRDQARFKYVIHLQGHVAAFRLTRELSYSSLIIKVDNPWKTWYSDELVGYSPFTSESEVYDKAHYVLVKSDLSDLVDVIRWCKQHDKESHAIAKRGYEFWKSHFKSPDYMFDYMQKQLTNIAKNSSTGSRSRGIVIIPFRDDKEHRRQKQLDKISKFIEEDLNIDYDVIVQEDEKLFNRGLLLNNGYLKHRDNYDYFIFHDVDLIPDEDLIKYYSEYPEVPVHLCYRGNRYSVKEGNKPSFIGGILSINRYDFEAANGFPNDFWGWGGEDDALYRRLKRQGIEAVYPPEGSVTDLEGNTIEEKMEILRNTKAKNMTKREQLQDDNRNWFRNGLTSLE